MTRSARIVFFGLPNTGKTGLLHAFADPEAPSPLSHEAPSKSVGPCRTLPSGIVLCDVDGQAAKAIIGDPKKVSDETHTTALAVRSADAIVLALDASASHEHMLDLFRSFGNFLDDLEEQRTHGREVGGLPVFLTLTKCDTLGRAGDDPREWLQRVEARKQSVRTAFEDYLAEKSTSHDPLTFGSIEVHIAATALQFPQSPGFAALDAPYGVEELRDDCTKAADEHEQRTKRSHKRLRWTLAGAIATVGTMVATLLGLTAFAPSVSEDQLARRLQTYQEREGSAVYRFSDRNFEKNRREIRAIRDDFAFHELPVDLQQYVGNRLREFHEYHAYREQFLPPRLGPTEVRTAAELDVLDTALPTLAPPADHAPAWADTEAVKLWNKWRQDAKLLRQTEGTLHEWYRSLVRRGTTQLLAPGIDFAWWQETNSLLGTAEKPPFDRNAAIPGSDKLLVQRGAALRYSVAFEFDRIDRARTDWDDTKSRVLAMRTIADLLGMTAGPNTPPAFLLFPEPTADVGASAKLASELLPKLPEMNGSVALFPDPMRTELQKRLRTSLEAGAKHVHSVLRTKRLSESREPAMQWLQEPDAKKWGQLLGRIGKCGELENTDPVDDAIQFLKRDKFEADLNTVEISIPNDLLDRRLVPGGSFVIHHTLGDGTKKELAFRAASDPENQGAATLHRLVPTGDGKLVFGIADAVRAEWPMKAGDREFRLEWSMNGSKMYAFDALNREPTIRQTLESRGEKALGVRLSASSWPRVPLLLKFQ